MAIKFAPPWLKRLSADDGPLVDDAEVQREVARLKVRYEREERRAQGEMFVDPMVEADRPEAPTALGDIVVPLTEAPRERFDRPVQPTPTDMAEAPTEAPPRPVGLPGAGGGTAIPGMATERPTFFAPPAAPPPPLPADRPPGTFQFDPRRRPDEEWEPGD